MVGSGVGEWLDQVWGSGWIRCGGVVGSGVGSGWIR